MSSDAEAEARQLLAGVRRSWAAGRLAHAYLVVGPPRGAGGVLAERLVALLFCTGAGERPCGACPGCRRVADHVQPDVAWIEPQKKSRGILLDDVVAAQDLVSRTAIGGGWKAVVFLHADRLNPQAANRLLKTLEEPPPRTLLLLVTERREALLPTLRSRCQRLVLPGEEQSAGGDARAAVIDAMTAGGGDTQAAALVRAQRLIVFLKKARAEIEASERAGAEAAEADEAAEGPDVSRDIREARIEARYKETVAALLRWLLQWQRDILLRVAGAGDAAPPVFGDQDAAVRRQAASLTYRRALANVQAVDAMRWQIERHLPPPMVLEHGIVRLTAGRHPG